jgi:outer membrane receptor protein involved in Fe transport
MGTAQYGRFTFQAGVRREDTETKIKEVDPYTPDQTSAQGYEVDADGIATTPEGVHWQFLSRPRVLKKKSYHNYFPSASVKYQIMSRLDLVVAAHKSIRRPGYYDATGVFRVSDSAERVYLPNRDLKTEKGETIAVRLSYYFKRIGQLSASFYQSRLTNMITDDELTASEAGFDENHSHYDPKYLDYIFVTKYNSGAPVRVRSMELSYSQTLGFLGKAFRRCNVHCNYTRAYADQVKTQLAPHQVSTGFNYTYKNLNLWSNLNWTDDFPTSGTGQSYRYHRTQIDAGTHWRFRSGYILGLTARNLTSAPHIHMQKVPPNEAVMQNYLVNSITWTCYVKKTF